MKSNGVRKAKKTGRPSNIGKIDFDMVFKLYKMGLTDKQVAEIINISESTLNNYKKEYPEFLQSLKRGKEISDNTVVNALYQKAIGYNGNPPDTTACIFWLKNRLPGEWRERQTIDQTIEDKTVTEIKLTMLGTPIDDTQTFK